MRLARRALLAAAGAALAPGPAPAQVAGFRLNQRVPAFTFRDPAGRALTLDAFRGRVALLLFWATWSRDCDAEVVQVDALAQRWRADRRVAIATFAIVEPLTRAAGWLQRRRLALDVYAPDTTEEPWDIKLADGKPARMTADVPYGYVLDAGGVIRLERRGTGRTVAYEDEFRRLTGTMPKPG